MSQSTTRVLALLELLQARPGLRGTELAARLGVDERTVRRYAAALADLGVPVEAARGRYGGYRLRPSFKLPPLMLTDDEAVAAMLGLLAGARIGAGTAGATGAALAAESARAKIERVLPPPLRDRVQALEATLGFTLPERRGVAPQTAHLLALGEAARDGLRVELSYRSWRGGESRRAFDPYGLVFHSGRWYLTGLDQRSGEVRTLRLDRIGSVTTTAQGFAPPPDFDPVAQVTDSLANVPYAHRVEVVLRVGLAEARRRIPPSVGTLTEVDGGVLLRTRAERLDGMAQMLAGLGWDFTIRTPGALRQAVRDLAERLVRFTG